MTQLRTGQQPPTHTDLPLTDLARSLVRHLNRECAVLGEIRTVLQELLSALRTADSDRLRGVQVHQADLTQQLDLVRQARVELLHACASILELNPAELCLRAVVARLAGPLAQQLEEARQRAQALARDVEALNRQSSRLARHCLTFVQGCLADLYGDPNNTTASRYSSTGKAVEAARVSLLETQG